MKKNLFIFFLCWFLFLSSCSISKYKNMEEADAKEELMYLLEFLENNPKFSVVTFADEIEEINLTNYYEAMHTLELGNEHTYDLKATLIGKSIEYIFENNVFYKYDLSSNSVLESQEMLVADFKKNYMCEQTIKVDIDKIVNFDYDISNHKNLWSYNSTYTLSTVSKFEDSYTLSFVFLGNEYSIHEITMSVKAIENGSKIYSFTGIADSLENITITFSI